jgi:hypothetical protein
VKVQFEVVGGVLMLLAVLHGWFPRYFHWKEELEPLSLINRQMMIVHTFFIALIVFLMGLLCLFFATELIETRLGKVVTAGFGVFWLARLFVQFFGYSSALWKGKIFESTIHVLFVLLWTYLSVLFIWNTAY